MTEEDHFQAHLDRHPEDAVARMAFADWLDERGDPRGPGTRALGIIGRHAIRILMPGVRDDWSYYRHNANWGLPLYKNGLPVPWSRAVGNRHVAPSRRELDDTVALAFGTLDAEVQARIIDGKAWSDPA